MWITPYGVMYTSSRPGTELNPYEINCGNPAKESFIDCMLQNKKKGGEILDGRNHNRRQRKILYVIY